MGSWELFKKTCEYGILLSRKVCFCFLMKCHMAEVQRSKNGYIVSVTTTDKCIIRKVVALLLQRLII